MPEVFDALSEEDLPRPGLGSIPEGSAKAAAELLRESRDGPDWGEFRAKVESAGLTERTRERLLEKADEAERERLAFERFQLSREALRLSRGRR